MPKRLLQCAAVGSRPGARLKLPPLKMPKTIPLSVEAMATLHFGSSKKTMGITEDLSELTSLHQTDTYHQISTEIVTAMS